MNLTLSSLIVVRYFSTSPLIALAQPLNFVALSRISLSYSMNPFLYGHSSLNTFIHHSKFSKFLDSVVTHDSMFIEQVVFTSFLDKVKFNKTLSIKDCVFNLCENTKHGGIGATLFYNNPNGNLKIVRCGYDSCFAQIKCGAFFANCRRLKIKRSYIYRCRAIEEQMAFSVYSDKTNSSALVDLLTIFKCGPTKDLKDECIIASFGIFLTNISQTNVSYIPPLQASASIDVTGALSSFSFVHFEANNGPGLIHIEKSTNIENCNVIRTNADITAIFHFLDANARITELCFFSNIFDNFLYTDKCENITFYRCLFDNSKQSLKISKKNVVFKKCKFDIHNNVTYLNLFEEIGIMDVFYIAMTDTFAPSNSFSPPSTIHPPTKSDAPMQTERPTKSLSPTNAFTASADFHERALDYLEYSMIVYLFGVIIIFAVVYMSCASKPQQIQMFDVL